MAAVRLLCVPHLVCNIETRRAKTSNKTSSRLPKSNKTPPNQLSIKLRSQSSDSLYKLFDESFENNALQLIEISLKVHLFVNLQPYIRSQQKQCSNVLSSNIHFLPPLHHLPLPVFKIFLPRSTKITKYFFSLLL